jgi:hypothetical protein
MSSFWALEELMRRQCVAFNIRRIVYRNGEINVCYEMKLARGERNKIKGNTRDKACG